jgi:glycerate dehydrogenase
MLTRTISRLHRRYIWCCQSSIVHSKRWSSNSYSSTTSSAGADAGVTQKPRAVFLNASRLNYDGQLNFASWYDLVDVVLHDADRVDDARTVLELVHDAEIVITKEMPVPISTLQQFPNSIQLLCEAGTGYNNLPVLEARRRNITVCNIPTYSTDAVAHMAITYLLNFSSSMFQQQHMLRCEKNRSNFMGPFTLPLHEVNGTTLGLMGGAGRIGTTVAKIGLALGMKIIISSRRGALPDGHELNGHPNVICTSDINHLLQYSDYVSLHTPLNDETRGSFGRAQIEQMKSTAYLINTSRGAVCNEQELIDCLQEQRIAGAGLDVTSTEPPTINSPLWDLPNVYLTPHTGWRRQETRQRLVDMTADNIRAYCEARTPNDYINVVN